MTVAFTNKVTKGGQKWKYFYYHCATIGHKGWSSCSTKQIGADRLHEMIQRNLHRISMDPDYLENLLSKHKNQIQCVNRTGYEPSRPEEELTVQNVQNHLHGILRLCARKPGIEKSLSVRGQIQQIHYSKSGFVWSCVCSARPSVILALAVLQPPPRPTRPRLFASPLQ